MIAHLAVGIDGAMWWKWVALWVFFLEEGLAGIADRRRSTYFDFALYELRFVVCLRHASSSLSINSGYRRIEFTLSLSKGDRLLCRIAVLLFVAWWVVWGIGDGCAIRLFVGVFVSLRCVVFGKVELGLLPFEEMLHAEVGNDFLTCLLFTSTSSA